MVQPQTKNNESISTPSNYMWEHLLPIVFNTHGVDNLQYQVLISFNLLGKNDQCFTTFAAES